MAKAGFWSIGGYTISFHVDGNWYADEEVIGNRRICELFSRHIRSDGQGGWVVDIGIDRQAVVVEDTALVVVAVEGSPQTGFQVRTNDRVADRLDCSSLRVGPNNVLYCKVQRGERGEIEARFLRPPYYRLVSHMEESAGGTVLRVGGDLYRLGTVGGSARMA